MCPKCMMVADNFVVVPRKVPLTPSDITLVAKAAGDRRVIRFAQDPGASAQADGVHILVKTDTGTYCVVGIINTYQSYFELSYEKHGNLVCRDFYTIDVSATLNFISVVETTLDKRVQEIA